MCAAFQYVCNTCFRGTSMMMLFCRCILRYCKRNVAMMHATCMCMKPNVPFVNAQTGNSGSRPVCECSNATSSGSTHAVLPDTRDGMMMMMIMQSPATAS